MRHVRVISTVVVIAACSAIITSQTPSGHAVFEQALAKERVEGNLPEAIRLYERVVTEFASDRALASRALLQAGLCREKLGQAGARAAYERLLREYPDQVQIAGEAKTRLAALAREATAPAQRLGPTVRELPNVPTSLESVSPDGTKAVVLDLTKGVNIAIVELATGQSRLFTNFDETSPFDATDGQWSPDGQHIAYVQGDGQPDAVDELRVATLDGKARTVYRNRTSMMLGDWLPDGSAIMTAIKRPDRTWVIGPVTIAAGGFTPLRTLGWDFTWQDRPRVSPNGRFIAFVERTAGQGDLHVLSLDGSHAFTITYPADDRQPIWSPDGRQLAFISNRLGADALWTVTIEDGRPKGEAVKLKDGMNGVRLIDWSRRGLIYEQTEQSWDVFTLPMDPRSARSTGSPRSLPYVRSGWNVSPVWSPDGKSLAFLSGSLSDPRSRYLVVMPPSGSAREFLIPPSTYPLLSGPSDLRWFGNGRGLGFSWRDAKGQEVVFRLSLSDGVWAAIPRPGTDWWTGIEWNDDGTAFYFVRHGHAERNGVFRKNVDDSPEELLYELTTPEASAFALEISPDRRSLTFHQRTTKGGVVEMRLIVVNLVSGERRTVVPLTGTSQGGETLRLSGWSPDGRLLVVQHRPSGSGSARWLLVSPDGGATQPVSADIPASMGGSLLKWSPDGASIAFSQHGKSERVFILENPLGDLPIGKIGATRR